MLHPIRISSRGRIFNALDGKRRMTKYGVRPSLPYQGIARRALTNPLVNAAIQYHFNVPFTRNK